VRLGALFVFAYVSDGDGAVQADGGFLGRRSPPCTEVACQPHSPPLTD
jgi:hypothetical protein